MLLAMTRSITTLVSVHLVILVRNASWTSTSVSLILASMVLPVTIYLVDLNAFVHQDIQEIFVVPILMTVLKTHACITVHVVMMLMVIYVIVLLVTLAYNVKQILMIVLHLHVTVMLHALI